jgi:hypothetical protein
MMEKFRRPNPCLTPRGFAGEAWDLLEDTL